MKQHKERILEALGQMDGFLPLTKNSKSETIRKTLDMSKKDFLAALRSLEGSEQIVCLQEGIKFNVKIPASGKMFRQVRKKRR